MHIILLTLTHSGQRYIDTNEWTYSVNQT